MQTPLLPRTSVGALTALGFGLAIVAGGVVGLASYQSLIDLERDTDARYATHITLMSLARLLTHIVDAETGQRGYLITGDEAYLEPYDSALSHLNGDTLSLHQSALTDSALRPALTQLSPLIGTRLAQLDTTIRWRRSGHQDRVRAMIESGRGKRVMDSIRVVLAGASSAAETRRDTRTARVRAASRRTKVVIFASGALTVSLLIAAGYAISQQLTARNRAEAALLESEHQTAQMLEAMPIGVYVVDAKGNTYFTNQVSRELLGKQADPGTPIGALPEFYQAYRAGTDELYPKNEQSIVRALGGEKAHSTDVEIRRPDRVVPIEVWAAPLVDAEGRVTHAIAAFGDMTERERARQELESANRELEAFSYSVSHDLRAPLRAIDGFSRMLVEDYANVLDDEGKRLLDVVRKNAQRMGRLIDDLLAFSKFSRRELRATNVNMAALAQIVLEDLQQAGADGRAAVTIDALPPATGDQSLLKQVWANLIGNALKYSRKAEAPRVTVSAERRGSNVEYRIRDNGVGFDMAYADKLFGVFQRLHGPDEFEGTGVGLATVQRIIHRHGGRIWAESRPGEGATFFFTLPAGD